MRPAIALVTIPIVAVALSACGGSSSSGTGATTNSAHTNNAVSNSAGAAPQGGPRSGRFASMRSCLQKEGVNFPTAPSGGAGRPGSGGPPSGSPGRFRLPSGVSRTKFQEAIKKCGGGSGFLGGAHRGFNSATARAALTKYAECLRENGVNVPAPNTSGKGPVFNTKGIDTSSEAFKTAQKKCQSDLKGAFGAGGPRGGQPPAGEGGPPPGGYGRPPGTEGEGG